MASQISLDTNTFNKLMKVVEKFNKQNIDSKFGNTEPMKKEAALKQAIDNYCEDMIKNKVIKWN